MCVCVGGVARAERTWPPAGKTVSSIERRRMTPSARQTAEGVSETAPLTPRAMAGGHGAWGWVPGALCRGAHKLGSESPGTGRRTE